MVCIVWGIFGEEAGHGMRFGGVVYLCWEERSTCRCRCIFTREGTGGQGRCSLLLLLLLLLLVVLWFTSTLTPRAWLYTGPLASRPGARHSVA